LELFMQPPALRLQALRLLHLLLEAPALAQLFECSLAAAATVARGDPALQPEAKATSDSGAAPMQLERREDGGSSVVDGDAWKGAAMVADALFDSFLLPVQDVCPPGSPASSSDLTAAASAEPAEGGYAVARAAMALVASLREHRQTGLLNALLLDEACGAPGCMLAQRLIQLAGAASALPGEDGALLPLCPAPGGEAALLRAQANWQQRLRVVQEALTLLRGLLIDEACGEARQHESPRQHSFVHLQSSVARQVGTAGNAEADTFGLLV
jgi:hypothetical protein